MFPISAAADAIVNDYPVKFQTKKRFPDRDQHKLAHFEVNLSKYQKI